MLRANSSELWICFSSGLSTLKMLCYLLLKIQCEFKTAHCIIVIKGLAGLRALKHLCLGCLGCVVEATLLHLTE